MSVCVLNMHLEAPSRSSIYTYYVQFTYNGTGYFAADDKSNYCPT